MSVTFTPLIGKPVRIKWRDPEDDWEHFWLRDVDGTAGVTMVQLQGRDSPYGQHDGGKFWTQASEIVTIHEDAA